MRSRTLISNDPSPVYQRYKPFSKRMGLEHYPKFAPRNRTVLYAVLIATAVVNSGTMGYDSMMMSSLISVDTFVDFFNLNAATTGLVNAGLWIGQILSVITLTYLADHFGRKKTIFVGSTICIVGCILQSASQNIAMFVVARIVLGYGVETTAGACPLLIAEVVPAERRGVIGGLYFTMFNAGAIVASGITYGTGQIPTTWAWRIPAILQGVPSIISIVMLSIVPESPRWAVGKGYTNYAKEVLEVSLSMDEEEASKVVVEIQESLGTGIPMSKQFSELFSNTKPMNRRLFIMFTLSWLNEMGGSSVGSYYLTVMLEQAGITTSQKKLEVNMISSCWNFVVSICGALLFDTLGRKKQSMISLSGMIVCFFILGGFVKKWGTDATNHSAQYATIMWMFLFNGFYNFCFTPIGTLYPAEVFPTNIRAAGMTFRHFWDSGFGLLAAFVLSLAMNAVGWKFYMINAGYDIIFLPIIYYTWVETKGLTLEEIANQFGDGPDFPESKQSVQYVESVACGEKTDSLPEKASDI